jgi:transposase
MNAHCRPAWHVPRVACRVPWLQEETAFVLPPILTFLAHFIPDRMTLAVQGWHLDETAAQLTLQVTTTRTRVRCPLCHTLTRRVHSRYPRTLADLPWGPYTVHLHLRVRKFFCDQPTCPCQIFTERLPTVAAPWARRTLRLAERLRACGLALGGEMGARLGHRLGLCTSPATLLRLVQGAPTPAATAPQVLGVDEWAWRRGQRYGTILVNLEDHQVLDLLPERSADLVAHWLTQHPTVTVVCRDRSALYADGIRRGAPHAIQVVDRFHLVKNLREAIEALLHDQRPALQAAAAWTAQALTQVAGLVVAPTMYRGHHQCSRAGQQRQEAAQQHRHAAWVATYEAIHTLRAQGTPVTTIAAQLGISRPTVYAYLRRTRPPSPRSPQRSGQGLRPYMTYLIQRWREGCTDSMQLWRETQALGYAHSARTVSRFITRLRQASAAGWAPETQTSPYTRPQGPSARAVSFTWVCPEAKRAQDAQLYMDQLMQADSVIAQAYTLSQAFLTLVRERRGAALTEWITEASASGIAALARFAQGLQEDLAAIQAGLTLPWSNGAVEGHVKRLKLLKRQGYGRAGVGLLRQRVMQAV